MNAFSIAAELADFGTENKVKKRTIFGRFMLPDMSEHPCQMKSIDADGVNLLTDQDIEHGTSIIAYLEDIGRVDGTMESKIEGGYFIAFNLTGGRRERMEKRLEWFEKADPGERQHDRFIPKKAVSRITLADGREYDCEVLDISVSGAAVKTHVIPSIGTYVSLGKMRGRVVRYTSDGIGIQFMSNLDDKTFREHATI
ncbi:MAG: PilZ domain-containing protein [Anderseniella sp.]